LPLITAAIGLTTEPILHRVDARWTMAFCAALGDDEDLYFDTTRASGARAHPLFAVVPEWPVVVASRELLTRRGLTADELRRAVHVSHDCHLERLIRPGDRLTTRGTILAIEPHRAGARVMVVFETREQGDALVCRSFHGTLFRDVELMAVNKAPVAGLAAAFEMPPPALPEGSADAGFADEFEIPLAAGFAHVYSECTRIWNPIHTDRAVARAAGLSGTIVHGTAPLALATSAIVKHYAGRDPRRVARIGARFRAMVGLPQVLRVQCQRPLVVDGVTLVPFVVRDEGDRVVLAAASVSLRA